MGGYTYGRIHIWADTHTGLAEEAGLFHQRRLDVIVEEKLTREQSDEFGEDSGTSVHTCYYCVHWLTTVCSASADYCVQCIRAASVRTTYTRMT